MPEWSTTAGIGTIDGAGAAVEGGPAKEQAEVIAPNSATIANFIV
jgi:hypothetical protein